MGKSSKVKPVQISLEVPDEELLKHVVDAYGLVCQYRTANKVPHEKMESWLLRLVVEGCNALYKFHNSQVAKQLEEQQTQQEGVQEDVKQETSGQV